MLQSCMLASIVKYRYLSAFIKIISLGIYQSNTKALSCYLLKSYVAHLNSINSSIRQSTKITWTLVKRNVTFDSAASLLLTKLQNIAYLRRTCTRFQSHEGPCIIWKVHHCSVRRNKAQLVKPSQCSLSVKRSFGYQKSIRSRCQIFLGLNELMFPFFF